MKHLHEINNLNNLKKTSIIEFQGNCLWQDKIYNKEIYGLVQERHNSSVLGMDSCLSCTNPLKYLCKCQKYWTF